MNMYDQQNHSMAKFYLFMIGLGSATKVFFFGTLGLSEIVVFLVAPLIFLRDWRTIKRDGFSFFIVLLGLLFASMLLSAVVNHTNFGFVFKTVALFYSVFAHYVVFHRLLRDNYTGLGYYVTGAAISSVIIIFAFNPHTALGEGGSVYVANAAATDVIHGPLFWAHRLNLFAQIPIVGAYMHMPVFLSAIIPGLYAFVVLATTISGRSATATFLMAGMLIVLGGKSRRRIHMMGRHVVWLGFAVIIVVLVLKQVYSYCAENGILGYEAQGKYLHQTRKGKSIFSMLVAGREEFFIGLTAAIHRPIIGYGPFAKDTEGFYENFIRKYGDQADYGFLAAFVDYEMKHGSVHEIPSHSHIIGAWVHYGIMGLIFYLIILKFIWDHLRRYAPAIPHWHGYFCMFICKYLWDFFFSGFYSRPDFALFIACLMFAKALAQGRLRLPPKMEYQIHS